MKSKRKRILFGAVDIGYRIEHYSKFIREHYHEQLEAESFSKYVLPESHYKTSYTYTCEIYKKSKLYVYCYITCFFIYSLFRFDVFHFLSGETILTRKLRRFELATYKLFGKKVIMHFVGADIRSLKYLDWKRENMNLYLQGINLTPPISEPHQISLVNDTERYADNIFVSTPDLLDIIPKAKFFPVMIDLKQLPKKEKKPNKIKILFSPSSHRTKGSDYVHEVLDLIQKKYKSEVELITPGKNILHNNSYALTRYELLRMLSEVSIVIDQMVIGWYGLKTVEALAMGCDVVCYIEKGLEKYQFENSPINNANINNLKDVLERLIKQKLINNDFVEGNRLWAEQYHTLEGNGRALTNVWLND